MKKSSKFGLITTGLTGIVIAGIVISKLVFAAGSATVSLSPASGTYSQGGTVSVDIYEDSGSDTVNAVQANLTYPSNMLSFAGITSSPAFGVDAQSTGGGGTVQIGRGANPAVAGNQLVATVRFTVIAGGTANINFSGGTAVVRSTDNGSESLTENVASYTLINPATIYISPATKSYTTGSPVDIAIYEDSGGTAVNAVQANLSYPTNLTFVSIDNNGSAFGTEAQNQGGGGSVKIGRGTINPVTGAKLVANVHFTASSAGTANITFAAGTDVVRSSDNGSENLKQTGAIYTISNPSAGGGGTGGGGTTSGSKPKTSLSKPSSSSASGQQANKPPVTTNFDNVAPTISDIQVTNLGLTSATITWKTSEPASSEVDYGLNTNYILSAVDGKLVTNHSLALNSKDILPHKTYHFMVKSTDAKGNLAASKDLSFTAEPPSKPKLKTGSFIVAFSVIVLIGAAAITGANYIRKMHENDPLVLPPSGASGSGTGAVIPPDSTTDSNILRDAIILNAAAPKPEPAPVIKPDQKPQPPKVQPKPAPAKPRPKVIVPPRSQPKPQLQTKPQAQEKTETKGNSKNQPEVPKQTDTPGTIIHPKK